MSRWTADFANDLSNSYELIVEILCDGKDVAVIRQTQRGLELKWYAHQEDLIVPLEWIMSLFQQAKNQLTNL